jgi:hypothetical protein
MKQSIELKPCPLCGSTPRPIEVSRKYVLNRVFYRGRIYCQCGLSFEKEWVETLDGSVKIPDKNATDVFEEWNELIETLYEKQHEVGKWEK